MYWRLFKNLSRPLFTAEGLAVDDTLPQSVAYHHSVPILHLYTFIPSAIVGKYQDIGSALNLAGCRDRGIEYNRRSTGGALSSWDRRSFLWGWGFPLTIPG